MKGKLLTLNSNDEIIKEETIDMVDASMFWNKKDSSGNRYFIVTENGSHRYKKKRNTLTQFSEQPDNV